jgi:hypothetical protein
MEPTGTTSRSPTILRGLERSKMTYEDLQIAAREALETADEDRKRFIYQTVYYANAAIADGQNEEEACELALREIHPE